MKHKLIISLLVWWFAVNSYGVRTVGPFASKEQCEAVRKEVLAPNKTGCWDDSPHMPERFVRPEGFRDRNYRGWSPEGRIR